MVAKWADPLPRQELDSVVEMSPWSILAGQPLLIHVHHFVFGDRAAYVRCLRYEMEFGVFGSFRIDCGLIGDVINYRFQAVPQRPVAHSADARGESFPGIKWRSVNAPHSELILAVPGIALGDPEAYDGASFQTDLTAKFTKYILEIIVGANRLSDHFVETGSGHLKTKHLVR